MEGKLSDEAAKIVLKTRLIELKATINNCLKYNSFCLYYGSDNTTLYAHDKYNKPYDAKLLFTDKKISDDMLESISSVLIMASEEMDEIKTCNLHKTKKGFRLRFSREDYTRTAKEELIVVLFLNALDIINGKSYLETSDVTIKYQDIDLGISQDTDPGISRNIDPDTMDTYIEQTTCPLASEKPKEVAVTNSKQNKEELKVNEFSLTNLKDALVSKITSLDKKTVTILAIIALVLLVVGKYQDIKDIIKGIVDKIKKSKNFKAMVEDGSNTVKNLKKIVGIKERKTDEN